MFKRDLIGLCGLLAACAGAGNEAELDHGEVREQVAPDDLAEVSQGLFVATSKLWFSGRIPVCWVDDGKETEKYWIRSAVYHTWEASSSVRFTGWQKCTPQDFQNGRSVRVKLTDVYGASLLGTDAAYATELGGVFTYLPTYPTGWCELFTPWEDCVRTSAVHEFGHVLGFDHEHLRPDGPDCPDKRPGEVADPYSEDIVGPPDLQSIMNYCRTQDPWRPFLSYWDVKGVRAFYGPDGWATRRELFDPAFYLKIYVDLRNAFGGDLEEATIHWLTHGFPREGRRASPAFDFQYYLSRYPDLAQAYGTRYPEVANHWLNIGLPTEGRAGALEFDVQYYKSYWGDIGNVFAGDNRGAALHWLNQGLPAEARRGSASFDPGYYRNAYVDLANAFGSDYVSLLAHWVEHGKREGRRAAP